MNSSTAISTFYKYTHPYSLQQIRKAFAWCRVFPFICLFEFFDFDFHVNVRTKETESEKWHISPSSHHFLHEADNMMSILFIVQIIRQKLTPFIEAFNQFDADERCRSKGNSNEKPNDVASFPAIQTTIQHSNAEYTTHICSVRNDSSIFCMYKNVNENERCSTNNDNKISSLLNWTFLGNWWFSKDIRQLTNLKIGKSYAFLI